MKKYFLLVLAFLCIQFSATAGALAQKYIYAAGLYWDNKVVELSWYDAIKYCQQRGKRLPTKNELVDGYKSGILALREPASGYWSSTPYAGFTTVAWRVYFGSGGVYYDGKTDNNYVRCVTGHLAGQ